MTIEELDTLVPRLNSRCEFLKHLLELALKSVPKEVLPSLLLAMKQDLLAREPNPLLPPDLSQLQANALKTEIAYLEEYLNALQAQEK